MPEPANPYTLRVRRLARLRQVLAAALVVAAAAVGVIYWLSARRERRAEGARPELKAPELGIDIQQSAHGVTVAKSEGGRPVFRISAQSAEKLRGGGQEILHQVDVQVYDAKGAPADQIHGDAFAYDAASGELRAQGRVQVTLTGRATPVRLEAGDLAYNVKDGTGSILQGVTFSTGAPGGAAASGSAATVELDSHAGVAVLGGGVRVLWQRAGRPDLAVHSREATLQRLADGDQITLEGAPAVAAGPQSLSARQLVLHLGADEQLRRVEASGDVQAADAAPGRALTAKAQRATAEVRQEGLTGLRLTGGATLAQTTPEARSSLTAGEVRFVYASAGVLRRVEASGGAVLSVAGREPERVSAPELDFDLAPGGRGVNRLQLASVHTRGRGTLQRGPLSAEADAVDMTLDARQQPASARANGDVRVRQAVAGGVRTSRSDALDLAFAQGQLQRAVERGGVQLSEPGPGGVREVWADSASYDPGKYTTVLEGHVRAQDAQANFTAARAEYVERPGAPADLRAAGGVALSALGGGKVAAGGAATVGPMLQNGQPVVVTADALHWTGEAAGAAGSAGLTGTASFDGGVRVLQAPNLLRADHVVVEAGTRTLNASGSVATQFVSGTRAVTVSARTLLYSDAARRAEYRGGVELQSADTRLAAPELTVQFSAGARPALENALATGGVRVTQPKRTARAERVSYDFAAGRIEMSGGSPSILDAERGEIRGDPLTFYVAGDEIQVGSKPGTRAQGRVIGHN